MSDSITDTVANVSVTAATTQVTKVKEKTIPGPISNWHREWFVIDTEYTVQEVLESVFQIYSDQGMIDSPLSKRSTKEQKPRRMYDYDNNEIVEYNDTLLLKKILSESRPAVSDTAITSQVNAACDEFKDLYIEKKLTTDMPMMNIEKKIEAIVTAPRDQKCTFVIEGEMMKGIDITQQIDVTADSIEVHLPASKFVFTTIQRGLYLENPHSDFKVLTRLPVSYSVQQTRDLNTKRLQQMSLTSQVFRIDAEYAKITVNIIDVIESAKTIRVLMSTVDEKNLLISYIDSGQDSRSALLKELVGKTITAAVKTMGSEMIGNCNATRVNIQKVL